MACLDKEGLAEINTLIDYYMENANIMREAMLDLGFKVRGTSHVSNGSCNGSCNGPCNEK